MTCAATWTTVRSVNKNKWQVVSGLCSVCGESMRTADAASGMAARKDLEVFLVADAVPLQSTGGPKTQEGDLYHTHLSVVLPSI